MKKFFLKVSFIFFCFGVSSGAFAGWQSGKITSFWARASDGLHYLTLEGAPQGRPACAAGTTYFMIKNENSVVGKTQISMVMAAYAAGKPIGVGGAGACTRWSDGEDVDVIQAY